MTVFSIKSAFRAMKRAWAWLTNLFNCEGNFELYSTTATICAFVHIFNSLLGNINSDHGKYILYCDTHNLQRVSRYAYFRCSLSFPVCINCQSNKHGLASQKWHVHFVKLKNGGIQLSVVCRNSHSGWLQKKDSVKPKLKLPLWPGIEDTDNLVN